MSRLQAETVAAGKRLRRRSVYGGLGGLTMTTATTAVTRAMATTVALGHCDARLASTATIRNLIWFRNRRSFNQIDLRASCIYKGMNLFQ